MELKNLECPSCGASLENASEGTYYCPYCGRKILLHNKNRKEIVYRDEAKMRELELREQARVHQEQQQTAARQREDIYKTLSILTSDEAGTALKSIGKLAMRFFKD